MEHVADAAAHSARLLVTFLLAFPIAWDREQKERSADLPGTVQRG